MIVQETSLNAKALSDKAKLRPDKKSLVKAFVSSQGQYLRVYALEGKKEAESWNDDNKLQLGSGFSTTGENAKKSEDILSSPLLKPRKPLQESLNRSEQVEHSSVVRKPRTQASRQQSVDKTLHSAKGKLVALKLDGKESKGEKNSLSKTSGKASTKRKRINIDSDEDKEERLAQRRVRRESKKQIIADPEKRDAGAESNSQAKTSIKKRKENNKQELPAGLALMHGFSAKNVGKHRITLGADVSLGVFNKGRASSKKNPTQTRKREATFDEARFLKKVPDKSQGTPKAKTPTRYSSVPDADHHSDSKSSRSSGDTDADTRDKDELSEKRTVISVSSHCSSSKGEQSVGDDDNLRSQVWSIEREFLPAENDKGGDIPPRKPESVVLKSSSWDWSLGHKSANAMTGICIGNNEKQNDENLDPVHSDAISSIAPSQSASHVALRRLPSSLANVPLKSKFFTEADNACNPRTGQPQCETSVDNHHQTIMPAEDALDAVLLKNITADSCVSIFSASKKEPPAGRMGPAQQESFFDIGSFSKSLLAEAFEPGDYPFSDNEAIPTIVDIHSSENNREASVNFSLPLAWVEQDKIRTHNTVWPEDYGNYAVEQTHSESGFVDDFNDGYMPAISNQAGLDVEEHILDAGSLSDVYFSDENVYEFDEDSGAGDLTMGFDNQAPTDTFLQGRALLLGMDRQSKSQIGQEGQYAGSLESVEAMVADKLQKSWYPLRF